jgi:aryl-alcohol dehydrogenase-like predicted oxidoreductase
MEYTSLGTTGLQVSRICLGTAFRATLFKEQYDDALCVRIVQHALDAGVNFIDTANFYSYGRSEEILGRALHGRRDDVVLATKVRSPVKDRPGPNDAGLSRFHVMRECERSLRRLRTDHIDLYWLHAPDDRTPIDETLRALDDLVHQGKVRYIGCCNYAAWQVCEALWRSDALGLNRFVAIQNQYSLLNRWEVEPELLPMCAHFGLGLASYSPLAMGLLSGRFRRGQPIPAGTPWSAGEPYARHFDIAMTLAADEIVQALTDIGAAHGKTPAQVALRWLLDKSAVTSIIIGPDVPAHVDDTLGALGWSLALEDRVRLDALSAAPKPFKFA